jgi:hypothetical protein
MPSWLILSYVLSVGFIPTQVQCIGESSNNIEYIDNKNETIATLNIEGEIFNHFRIGIGSNSYQTFNAIKNGLPSFCPYRIDYAFKFEIYDKGLSLGIQHECDHPILSDFSSNNKYFLSQTIMFIQYKGIIK